MDLFPLDLILIVAIASATLFLGYLPYRLLAHEIFARQIFRAGLAWITVAVIAPPAILHYYLFIGLLCLAAWWQLRSDHGLRGKIWLGLASGLGLSLGVVLILAVKPQAFPPSSMLFPQLFLLGSIYLGGAVIGLAYVVLTLTRPAATRAGLSFVLVQRYAGVLFLLTLIRAALALRVMQIIGLPLTGKLLTALAFGTLIFLAWVARRQTRGPTPSASGPALVGICLLGLAAEIVARSFGL